MRIILPVRIKKERLLREKTQDDMAQLLQINRATYGFYENGKVLPPIDKILILANYFGVTIDYLVGNEEKTDVDIVETIRHLLALLKNYPEYINADGQIVDKKLNKIIAASLEYTIKNTNIMLEDE